MNMGRMMESEPRLVKRMGLRPHVIRPHVIQRLGADCGERAGRGMTLLSKKQLRRATPCGVVFGFVFDVG